MFQLSFLVVLFVFQVFAGSSQADCSKILKVPHPEAVELANELGYAGLQHMTSTEFLRSIVEAGVLKSRGATGRAVYTGPVIDAVYLSLVYSETLNNLGPDTVKLLFKNDLLGRSDYHLSPMWAYGHKVEQSAEPKDTKRFAELLTDLQSMFKNHGWFNEVVFLGQINLSQLKGIYCHHSSCAKVYTAINEAGITTTERERFIKMVVQVP